MHFAPPALLAATLATSLTPAQGPASVNPSSQPSRVASGRVVDSIAVVAEEALAAAAAIPEPDVLSDAEPLPQAHARPARRERRQMPMADAVLLAQAGRAAAPSRATTPAASRASTAPPANGNPTRSCSNVTVDAPTTLTLGKSQVVRLPFPVARLILGGAPGSRAGRAVPPEAAAQGATPTPPAAATRPQGSAGVASDGVAETDVTLLSPTELFFLGRHPGSMNVVLQSNDGRCLVKDLVVTMDPGTLQAQLSDLMPEESGVKVRAAESSIVLTGTVSDAVKLDHIVALAGSYSDARKVVNLLRVTAPQQVMLEVKIAEVSKTLLDRFGLDFSRIVTSANGVRSAVISGIVGGAPGVLGRFNPNVAGGTISGNAAGSISSDSAAASAGLSTGSRGATLLGLDMSKQDGIVRVLAEPNIMSISGQPASFLSGGKIFIPVAQSASNGGTTITLEEKEFGVGLKFTPTVLDGRINLKIVSEVSELSQTGTPFTTVAGVTAVLPSLSTRRVDTTVQLGDGQSFAVAGLIRSNITEALNKFPGLGEAPVLGALFRSTEFQNDKTELMFVVTPRLVRPVVGPIPLPTDSHVVPTQGDVILRGKGEGAAPAPAMPDPTPVGGEAGTPGQTGPASRP